MSSRKYDLTELSKISKEWPEPLAEAIVDTNKRNTYINKKLAVDMYIGGAAMSEITARTKIKYNNILRMIDRCMTFDSDGHYVGYCGLLPGKHIKNYTKNEHSNTQGGLFTILLGKYPELKEFIKGNYFGDTKYTLEHGMKPSTLHYKFLCKCHELGIQNDEYPFNTQSKGEMSLRRYLEHLEKEQMDLAGKRESKEAYQKLMSTGIGEKYTKQAAIPFSVVQVDGHVIDLIYTVENELDDGRIVSQEAYRCWVFVIIDVATRCILGYSTSQRFNYNQYDVLTAIRNAICPHKETPFTIEGFRYPENGGFPSTAFKEARYALFDTIMLDNAKSHLAKNIAEKVVETLGCSLCFGSVATPETRGIVERFFGTLEGKGFHTLPATTGSNIKDIKRKNPEYNAKKYNVTYDDICQLLEQFIIQYNNSPHKALYNKTPMQEMEQKLKEYGMLPTIADERTRNVVDKLLYITKTVKVHGGSKSGKRPYIHYKYADYRNDVLAANGNFLGKDIVIHINTEDLSTVEAYTTEGSYIGTLKASGEYGLKKHSLKSRENINAYARKNKAKNSIFTTPVSDYETDLRKRATKSKTARTQADILRREQGKDTLSNQRAEKEKNPTPISNLEDTYNQDRITNDILPSTEEVKKMSSEELWKSIREAIN